ncbi:hypothetical protein [Streptosporangium sp. H16]|uniref:hypothetical protein n=1 Tax=Streptosporangium sp. H16 TaxID=3444184 RepID=UPI003F7A7F4A
MARGLTRPPRTGIPGRRSRSAAVISWAPAGARTEPPRPALTCPGLPQGAVDVDRGAYADRRPPGTDGRALATTGRISIATDPAGWSRSRSFRGCER